MTDRFEGFDDLPDRIAELERLLENRYPDRASSCGAQYHASKRMRHKIVVWRPGQHVEFAGATFGEAYRAAYEYCRTDAGDTELASWSIGGIDGIRVAAWTAHERYNFQEPRAE